MTVPARQLARQIVLNIADPLPAPPESTKPFPKYPNGPGYVEIKPHNLEQIRAGLAQLKDLHLGRPEQPPIPANDKKGIKGKPGKPGKPARPPKPGQPYLLTYTFQATPITGKSTVTAYVLIPKDVKIDPPKAGKDRQLWLRNLGDWWTLGTHDIWEVPFGEWRRRAGPPAAGSMIEWQLRDVFVRRLAVPYPKHVTVTKVASDPGADVDFLELAEFLYELDASLDRAA